MSRGEANSARVGRVYERTDDGYEAARCGAVWNGRKPARYPEVIVRAGSEGDVVAAVRMARTRGLRIGIRSGGHSWVGSGLRDGAMLLDLSELDAISVDPEAGLATIGPGVRSADLNRRLSTHNLFFPAGHCPTVGLAGFLLGGGYGWNSAGIGPACFRIRGMHVVDAEGELRNVDEHTNADLLWAARGAGPGFFGVVTRFELAVDAAPSAVMRGGHVYPLDVWQEVLAWVMHVTPRISPYLEVVLLAATRPVAGTPRPILSLRGTVFSDTTAEAVEMLALLDRCPMADRALVREAPRRVRVEDLFAGSDVTNPEGYRFAIDNMWTRARPAELVPLLRPVITSLPTERSYIFFWPWPVEHAAPNAAWSVQGPLYLSPVAVWDDAAADAANQAWVTDSMRRLAPLSAGIQLADADLVARPDRFLSDASTLRLENLRSKYDPTGVFHSYLR